MTWLNIFLAPIVVGYSILMMVLVVYVSNLFYLAWCAYRSRNKLRVSTKKNMTQFPLVTVQLPIYNEWYVAERLIHAVAALDHPADRLEIQVLDDSTDDTATLVAQCVDALRMQGVDIKHIHRSRRDGFKAGALAHGLAQARGEFIAIFDADFIPQPDFLRRMLPHFEEGVAFVQGRWGHLNRDYSFLTQLQSFSLDAHFAIDQLARADRGFVFNFNGTAGIWRKSAILDAGGWRADTLTEDMDLSYRVFLRGWSARYAGEVEVPAELPVSFTAFRRQQYRWARGSLECAIRYLPVIWRSNFSPSRKLQATLHLTGYASHFLALALIFMYPLLLLLATVYPTLLAPVGVGLVMNLLALVPAVYFSVAQFLLGRPWLSKIPLIFLMSIFASGMSLNTLRAAIQIAQQRMVPFERTPKYGITSHMQTWRGTRYQVKVDAILFYEFLLAALNLWTAWFAWKTSFFLIMMYALLFALGLIFMAGSTLAQTLATRFLPTVEPVST